MPVRCGFWDALGCRCISSSNWLSLQSRKFQRNRWARSQHILTSAIFNFGFGIQPPLKTTQQFYCLLPSDSNFVALINLRKHQHIKSTPRLTSWKRKFKLPMRHQLHSFTGCNNGNSSNFLLWLYYLGITLKFSVHSVSHTSFGLRWFIIFISNCCFSNFAAIIDLKF